MNHHVFVGRVVAALIALALSCDVPAAVALRQTGLEEGKAENKTQLVAALTGLEEVAEQAVRQVADQLKVTLTQRGFSIAPGSAAPGQATLDVTEPSGFGGRSLGMEISREGEGRGSWVTVHVTGPGYGVPEQLRTAVDEALTRVGRGVLGRVTLPSPTLYQRSLQVDAWRVGRRQAVIDLINPAVPLVKHAAGEMAKGFGEGFLTVLIDPAVTNATPDELQAVTTRFQQELSPDGYPKVQLVLMSPDDVNGGAAAPYDQQGPMVRLAPEFSAVTPGVAVISLKGIKDGRVVSRDILPAVVTGALAEWQRQVGRATMNIFFDVTPYLNITGLTLDDIWQILTERFA